MSTRDPVPPLSIPLLAGVLVVALGVPVQAQDDVAMKAGGWSFGLTPYVWFAGMKGNIAALPGLPPASVDAGFDDIIENTDMAFMLAADAQRGRFGIVTDFSYLALSADGDTPGRLFGAAEVESKTIFATAAGFYRVVAEEDYALDLAAGARVWYVDTEIGLGAGLLPARRVQDDETWVDPVVGLRGTAQLGRGFFLAGAVDIGGFGVGSDLTWQLLSTLGYRFSDWFSARIGYRHIDVDYDQDGFVWDVRLSGPIIGATVRF
ncbi:MAG TPA: hypothetical protein VK943_01065 [Arenibaculum sp.]|nr:hypothetical protein [Arenibaculum sp.]